MFPTIAPPIPAFPVAALQAVRRALPHLMLATITAGLAAFVAQSWFTPRFQVDAVLTVGESSDRAAAVAGHVRGLSAPEWVLAVAKEQDLQRWPDFNGRTGLPGLLTQLGLIPQAPTQPALNTDEGLLSRIYRRLSVVPGHQAGTIDVRLTASDPDRAARFVNRLIGAYLNGMSVSAVPVQVTVWAEAPERPIFPRKGATALVGMGLVLLLGLAGIIAREAFRRVFLKVKTETASAEVVALDERPAAPRFVNLDNVPATSEKLLSLATMDQGFRTIISGETRRIDPSQEALQLATELSRAGRRVVLVRWALEGGDVIGRVLPGQQGINDLMQGVATFEDIIKRLPDCQVHGIAAGSPATDQAAVLDPDRLNLVLDTLDEVYDHIVVVARYADAQALFVALEGRFDACVSVTDEREEEVGADSLESFLGFEVTDIDIIHLHRPVRPLSRRSLHVPAPPPRVA